MLLMNPCTHDTRVMKEAISLTNAGYEVHIVALMKLGLEKLSLVDGVSIHRVKPNLVNVRFITRVFLFCCGILALPRLKHTKKVPKQRVKAPFSRSLGKICSFLLLPISAVFYVVALAFGVVFKIARMPYRLLPYWFRNLPTRLSHFLPYSYRLHSINFDLGQKAIELEPNIIQSHDCNTLLAGAMVKKTLGIPLVYDSHELYLERNIGSRSRWWDKLQWSPIEKNCIQHCDVVMTVSQGIVDHLSQNNQA